MLAMIGETEPPERLVPQFLAPFVIFGEPAQPANCQHRNGIKPRRSTAAPAIMRLAATGAGLSPGPTVSPVRSAPVQLGGSVKVAHELVSRGQLTIRDTGAGDAGAALSSKNSFWTKANPATPCSANGSLSKRAYRFCAADHLD
jgi:hypothetical protein